MLMPFATAISRLKQSNGLCVLLIFGTAILCSLPNIFPFGSITVSLGPNDLGYHLHAWKGYVQALSDGQIVPQVNPEAAGGFGYSSLIFYGPLQAVVCALLFLISQSWLFSVQTILILSFFLAGIAMYKFVMDFSDNKITGTIAAILYITAPPELFQYFGWQGYGAVFGYIFIPILFMGFYRVICKKEYGVIFAALGMSGLILTHILSMVMSCIFLVILLLLNVRKLRNFATLKKVVVCAMLTVGICAYFLLPFLKAYRLGIYQIFGSGGFSMAWVMDGNGIAWFTLGKSDYFTQRIFYTFLAIVIAFGIYLLLKNKLLGNFSSSQKLLVKQSFVCFCISLVLVSAYIPWSHLPASLSTLQTPMRFICMANFFGVVVVVFFFQNIFLTPKFKPIFQKVIVIVCTLFFISISVFTVTNSLSSSSGRYELDNTFTASEDGYVPEYLPANAPDFSDYQISSDLIEFKRTGSHSSFYTSNKSDDIKVIELPFVYYDGYAAWDIVGQQFNVSFSANGLVQVEIPAHFSGEIFTHFAMSFWTLCGLIITLLSIGISITYIIIRKRKIRLLAQ
ncbi:hypothetical protein FACS1894125_1570 [Actinomycetota bacterium]|nr:hypothetical protein FACS1894125_1570 [Actinomycetota bacterium]